MERAAAAICRLAIAALLSFGFATPACADAQGIPVMLRISNDGVQPQRCMILFGHWVSREVGVIGAGGARSIAMMRATGDGALYIARADGRRMMIENVICGAEEAWAETLGQVPLLPVRASGEQAFGTSCRSGQRVTCSAPSPR